MQKYICKCGKTFEKSTKAETTGYELHDYSPQHECYGCPYIVTERAWQTNEIAKRECRATPKITYLSKCHIGTGKGDFTACKVYSLDLTFVKRVMNYVNSLDGAEETSGNCIPDEWRAADFGKCYSSDNCFGLAIFDLYFKKNKEGTEARKLVKERFFTESGFRKDMTEEKERETVLMRIQIAKENARNKANVGDVDANLMNDKNDTLNVVQEQWDKTHLCGGSVYVDGHCEYLIEPTEDTVINGKEVKKCNPYCTAENKVRKIGTGGLWTGLSPKFCPKRKALEQRNDEPTEDDFALFEQYRECYGRYCRFDKVYGTEHKYTKQHYDEAQKIYDKIVSQGLEQAYKKWREMNHKNSEQQSMCDSCANNDGSCLKPTEGECVRYVTLDEAASYTAEPTYFDVLLQHYPAFEVSRYGEFVKDVCTAECFDDVNSRLGNTARKHDTACKISCEECWKNVCTLQWKLFEGTEKYIEPYLTAEKQEDTMARKLQIDAAITRNMQSAASDSFIDNIKMIEVDEILENDDNFYSLSDIELLADDIEREGLKHNLVVAKDGTGYRLKSGHRRLAAIKLLIKEKRRKNTKIPCYVDGEKTSAETQFDLIMLNATQRKYSDADVMHEYEEIERTFKALEAEGKPLKGRIRDNIAAVLKVSPAQVGKIENIKHNAVPEVEKAVKSGAMSISTANEVAKLPGEKQREIAEKSPDISHKEVKKLQEIEKPPVPKKVEPVEEIKDDLNELDDLFEDDEDELDEKTEVTSEKKGSPRTFTLTLSEDDASTLLNFMNDWADDNDDDAVVDVWNKLKVFVG